MHCFSQKMEEPVVYLGRLSPQCVVFVYYTRVMRTLTQTTLILIIYFFRSPKTSENIKKA